MKVDNALLDLIKVSNTVGMDKTLVQGGGGNTSIKTDDGNHMYIKASGTALGEMNLQKGWRKVKLSAIKNIFEDRELAIMIQNEREKEIVKRLLDACDDDITGDIRPSVEAPFHAILGKCVIHLHALAVLAYVCSNKGRELTEKMFNDENLSPLWIPYSDPGYSLGLRVHALVMDYLESCGQLPQIIFMEKHGVIISSEDKQQGLRIVKKVIDTCSSILSSPFPKESLNTKLTKEHIKIRELIEMILFDLTGKNCQLKQFIDDDFIDFCERKDAEILLKAPPMTPDEMGFVENIIWLENDNYDSIRNSLDLTIKKYDKVPSTFMIRGGGLLVRGSDKLSLVIRDIVAGSLFIRVEAQNFGGINPLNNKQREFIENWEAEKFRVQLADKV
jgi:rhamnose utilization protein RhaD (predicted bifunctional aldolase and dehydrogenase)